ncbi:bifunctional metallophosphatase/5'-nucleotidase, partial [Alistipes onderdonkii]
NVVSDTCPFPQLPPYTIVDRDGIRIGFVGVVTNYEGPGHPAGNESSFAGLEFPDPQAMALKYAAELRPECDVLVLVSHMGDDRDAELLAKGQSQYDVVIGGHTHEEVDTLIGGTLLTQTGKDLRNIGVTTVRMKGHKVAGVDYRIVPLADYEPDILYQKQVEAYYADPGLNKPVGRFGNAADKWGLANWMAAAVADEADADVGFYHIGGVRLDSIPAGGVSAAKVYGLEPFGTLVARMEMTPAQMRRMIVSKYNDPVNAKEAHRIDLISTTPYVIVTDAADNALDVQFPKLREGRKYKVAVSDYIYRNYKDMEYTGGEITVEKVADILLEELRDDSPLKIDNTPRQRVVRK